MLALAAHLYPGLVVPNLDGLARAIDAAAHAIPLEGDPSEMAAELAVLAATEGHFDARAVGTDAYGDSLGLWQIHRTTLIGYLRIEPEHAFDPVEAAMLAAWLIRKSHEVCRGRPRSEALAWFAAGGPTCAVPEGRAASQRRMQLVAWALAVAPPYWLETTR